jgi:hypothetical protein
MSKPSKHKLVWARKSVDPILRAVMSAIHQTAEKPPKGYLTREQWMNKWGFNCPAHTGDYINKAIEIGKLECRRYRVMTKGRLVTMAHYGPPLKN